MIRISTIVAVGLTVGLAACGPDSEPAAPEIDVELTTFEDVGGDFGLLDQDGQPWQLDQHRGQVVLLFFGFTSCPDACPVTMSKVAQAYRRLREEGENVTTVFVSIDRTRDTPDVLKDYVGAFSIPVVGLTGTTEQIDAVTAQYQAQYIVEEADNPVDYQVAHTTTLYLIDQDGRLRYRFPYQASPDLIASGVAQLLETASASD